MKHIDTYNKLICKWSYLKYKEKYKPTTYLINNKLIKKIIIEVNIFFS